MLKCTVCTVCSDDPVLKRKLAELERAEAQRLHSSGSRSRSRGGTIRMYSPHGTRRRDRLRSESEESDGSSDRSPYVSGTGMGGTLQLLPVGSGGTSGTMRDRLMSTAGIGGRMDGLGRRRSHSRDRSSSPAPPAIAMTQLMSGGFPTGAGSGGLQPLHSHRRKQGGKTLNLK